MLFQTNKIKSKKSLNYLSTQLTGFIFIIIFFIFKKGILLITAVKQVNNTDEPTMCVCLPYIKKLLCGE